MNKRLLKIIIKYLKLEEEQQKLIKFAYDNTEIFEQKYMIDFPDELFRFFSGKITRYATEYNKIMNLLPEKAINQMKEIELEIY